MNKINMDLTKFRQKHDQGDLLRSIEEAVVQPMMESDVDSLICAGRHEPVEQRTIWRNGYRDRSLDTRPETLNPKVPKLRRGGYFLSFLEARKTSEQALVAVIQEACVLKAGSYSTMVGVIGRTEYSDIVGVSIEPATPHLLPR